ncbi:MAG: SPFH domain-containing protein, partial [Clostridia bacterium]|nr:SPFH domain-containing protein [Clostridia bacterium]
AQMQAMQKAAENSGGAVNGFMGIGMMNGMMGGMGASQTNLMNTAQQLNTQPAPTNAPAVDTWTCSCGAKNSGKFCAECGSKKPDVPAGAWECTCGAVNTGKFCPECGSKKPSDGYTCSCGYKSDKPYKFCPQCGEKFNG